VAKYTVGSVPYLNAKPLVKPLIWAGAESPVKVRFAVPSLLPEMLEKDEAQAILVSSISALTDPNATVADDLSIGTQGAVQSVRLFSKVPLEKIETLAEDQSSITSNALAKILLAEKYGLHPRSRLMDPSGRIMLSECDACVLIGDNGMRYDDDGLYSMDLGEAWFQLTGLPFVWAVWKGGASLTGELVRYLQESLATAREEMKRVISESATETGFTREQCRHYLLEIMDYRLREDHLEGLTRFGELLKSHGLVEQTFAPTIIKATPDPEAMIAQPLAASSLS
jgi:chorismate dehydratase